MQTPWISRKSDRAPPDQGSKSADHPPSVCPYRRDTREGIGGDRRGIGDDRRGPGQENALDKWENASKEGLTGVTGGFRGAGRLSRRRPPHEGPRGRSWKGCHSTMSRCFPSRGRSAIPVKRQGFDTIPGQSSYSRSVVDRLVGGGPEVVKDARRFGGIREALSHEDPDHVFLWV